MIEAGPCVVTQVKTPEKDGYAAVQLAYDEVSEKNTSNPLMGHFKKANTTPKRKLVEFTSFEKELNLGDVVTVDIFEDDDWVDVTGISKGKGFQGVVKRHGFGCRSAQHTPQGRILQADVAVQVELFIGVVPPAAVVHPFQQLRRDPLDHSRDQKTAREQREPVVAQVGQTHGQHNRQRKPGSLGASSYPSRVFKGKRLPGRTGGDRVKVLNLRILKKLPENNLLLVKGSIPGAKGSYLIIED